VLFRPCDVPKGQAGTGDSIQPFPGEFGDVRHEERAITPIAGGPAALLICLGAVLAAAFKKIKNRGNELKDLLQRKGISEIAASKRTHFRAERAAIGTEPSGFSSRCRFWILPFEDFDAALRIGRSLLLSSRVGYILSKFKTPTSESWFVRQLASGPASGLTNEEET